jgi:hypothetical protein
MSALAPYDDDAEGWAEVGAAIVSDIKAALERRDFKITELEAKYKALEAKSNALEAEVARQRAIIEAMGEVKYCGVWKEGREYLRGNFATIKGATWPR